MSEAAFDPHEPGFVRNPHPTLAYLRGECPVKHSELYGGFWLLSRYADVRAAAVDWRTFTSRVPGVTAIPMIHQRDTAQIPIELDPPEHSRYRGLIQPAFHRKRVAAMKPRLEEVLRPLLDTVAERGHGDLVAEVCVPFSLATLGEFLGLPADHRNLWLGWVRRMFAGSLHDRADAVRATEEFGAYIDGLIAARRREPSDDFFSQLLGAEVDGHHLTDDEIRAMGIVQLIAGHETSANAMAHTLWQLAQHPEHRARLQAEPALVPTAIEEFLRLSSPIQLFGRNTTRDVELHDKVIPEGAVVALGFAAANRDPEQFDEPDKCRLDRAPNRHLTFGIGHHLCIGAPIARLEMQVLLEQAPSRLPGLRLDPDAAPAWKPRGDQRGLATLPVLVSGREQTRRA